MKMGFTITETGSLFTKRSKTDNSSVEGSTVQLSQTDKAF